MDWRVLDLDRLTPVAFFDGKLIGIDRFGYRMDGEVFAVDLGTGGWAQLTDDGHPKNSAAVPSPYDQEADWSRTYVWASRAVDAGLGITAHAGEFSKANIEAALKLPGITRMGHGVHAASSSNLIDKILEAG